MLIVTDIVKELRNGATVCDLSRARQSYHESRRWSTDALFDGRRAAKPSQQDRGALYHASRAELTTQPAGIRLAIDGARMGNEIKDENPPGARPRCRRAASRPGGSRAGG